MVDASDYSVLVWLKWENLMFRQNRQNGPKEGHKRARVGKKWAKNAEIGQNSTWRRAKTGNICQNYPYHIKRPTHEFTRSL